MVEDDGSSLFGLLLRDSLGTAATAKIGARLFRLARGLVDDMALKDALGLHHGNPRQDVQNLLIARKGDLAVEAQLVHGEQVGSARPHRSRRSEYQYAIPAGQDLEKAAG